MIRLKITKNTVTPRLEKIIKNVSDLTVPFKSAGQLVVRHAEENFDRQGFYFGGWKPLADSTKKQRKRMGYGASRPILIRTGKLMRGFEIRNLTKDGVTIGNYAESKGVRYGVFHQYGTPKMPKRVILAIDQKAFEGIRRIFGNYFKDAINR